MFDRKRFRDRMLLCYKYCKCNPMHCTLFALVYLQVSGRLLVSSVYAPETDRQTDRQTETERQIQRESETDRHIDGAEGGVKDT